MSKIYDICRYNNDISHKMKKRSYKTKPLKPDEFREKNASYASLDDGEALTYIEHIRNGISYSFFSNFFETSALTMQEWSEILHLNLRTLQRYKKDEIIFDSLQSERILQILLLNNYGVEVFGSPQKFHSWLETDNVALGKIKPKSLFDSSFGINLIKDELSRIEQGILA